MSNLHICQYCKNSFSRNDALIRHIKKNRCKWLKQMGTPVLTISQKDTQNDVTTFEDHSCEPQLIKKKISKVSLIENLEQRMKRLENLVIEKDQLISELRSNSFQKEISQQITEFKEETKKEIEQLKNNPNINNQILQVVCISNNDNYLDILTQQYGDFDKALEYIKDCALSSLTGDRKLIEKIYMNDQSNSMHYIDKGKKKIQYFDENGNTVIDNKTQLGRKLANNLQNSYLKGVNYLINKNLDNRGCPNKFLEDYDLQTWNQHIFDLSDLRYHQKIMNNLNIPDQ